MLGLRWFWVNTDIEWPVESFTSNVDVPERCPKNLATMSLFKHVWEKTKPHSCLGFRETTNAQWLTSVNLTSQRLKSCFHMPRDRSVRSHLDG